MNLPEILKQLESLGNEKVRKQNKKRGAGENQFGVMMGDIRKLAAKLKTNHNLAMELWNSANIDARLLAILLMDPARLTATELEQMLRSESFINVVDWLYSYVIKDFKEKEKLREPWMNSDNNMCARVGWSLMAARAAREPEGIDLESLLHRIDQELPIAASEIQWTMNNTLANIGIYHAALRKRALAIGEKHGIYRDYPVSKGCTSPFAPVWINEIVKRLEK